MSYDLVIRADVQVLAYLRGQGVSYCKYVYLMDTAFMFLSAAPMTIVAKINSHGHNVFLLIFRGLGLF